MKRYSFLTLYPETPKRNYLKGALIAAVWIATALIIYLVWPSAQAVPAPAPVEVPVSVPKTLHQQGNVDFALIQVPVPITDDLEGQDIEYTVRCHLEDGLLACEEGA